MNKKTLLTVLVLSSSLFVGCTKEESFEDKVIRKFTYVDSAQSKLEAQVEDMAAQIELIKDAVGYNEKPKFTDEDLNFSSIKVLAKDAITEKGQVAVNANSEFNLNIDVINTTEENISQYIVQAYLTYNRDGQYYDRYLVDTRFDVLPKSVRKKIEFKDIPVLGKETEHILTVIIKDLKGNAISTFEKQIFIR